MSAPITAAVLTVSDRCSAGQAEDLSGPAVADALRSQTGATIASLRCVPDEVDQIQAALRAWVDEGVECIVTTGGTGLSPRDVTPEATSALVDRPHPGLTELARARTGATNDFAFLSRGTAGVCGRTLIINVPGSPKGATEHVVAISGVLPHAIETLRGDGSHDGSGR